MRILSNIINRFPIYKSSTIIKKIEKYEYISFDIFDTLVKRANSKPTDVFLNTAEYFNLKYDTHLSVSDFVNDRISAEKAARSSAKSKFLEEITIDDIYNELPNKYIKYKEKLKAIEIEREINCCIPNLPIKRVFDYCTEHGKKIYLISDMYLPETIIIKILNKCGYYNYTKAFVSSEIGIQKRNGKLFEYVINELNINPNKIIHVGDNVKSDYLYAKKFNINTINIARYPNAVSYTDLRKTKKKNTDECKDFIGFLNNCIDYEENPYYKFGFEVVGPLIYGFLCWLYKHANKQKIDKLLFMARDGYLMKKCYDVLFDSNLIKSEYFYASRRSLAVSLLCMNIRYEDFLKINNIRKNWNCKELCFRIGIEYSEGMSIWKNLNLNIDEVFRGYDLLNNDKVKSFYYQSLNKLKNTVEKENFSFRDYLESVGFSSKVGIVDSGGTGTSQKYLELYKKYINNTKGIVGFYLWYGGKEKPDIDSYYFPYENKPKNDWQTELIEFCMTSFEGTTLKYTYKGGKATPVLDEFEYNDGFINDIINNIQRGAISFSVCMKKWMGTKGLSDELCGYNAWRVSTHPKLKEVSMFSNIYFVDDDVKYNIFARKGFSYFIFHLCEFAKEYGFSHWQMGFLKNVFKIPFPYYDFVLKIKIIKNILITKGRKK